MKNYRLLWLLIGVYVAVLGTLAILRQYNFQTQTWDMGAFEQTFWNTVHGRVMQNNLEEVRNHLGVHMSPWLFALVPGYALFQSPYYLLIVQTLALALGAWPLYLLALRVLGSKKWALLIAAVYLLYPPLHWVNLFDFHEIAFFVPLLLAALYFIEMEKWLWAALFLALSASVEENAILAVMFVGLYLLTKRGSARKIGAAVAILSLAYFLLSVKVIMPTLGGGLLRLDRYANLGGTPGEIVRNAAAHPGIVFRTVFTWPKFWYVFWLFLPVAFLPTLGSLILIVLIPGLLQNLLTFFSFQFSSFYQYDAILVPGIFAASVYGLKYFLTRFPGYRRAMQILLAVLALTGFLLRSPLNPRSFPAKLFGTNERWTAFRQMAAEVPPGVTVAAQTNLIPHLAHRQHAYMLGREPFPADMVLLDLGDSFGFPDGESFQRYLDSYTLTNRYRVKNIGERYVILLRSDL